MTKFRTLNNLFGWLCFAAAFIVYMLTLQPSVSFWDCGEFISTAFNIQVGHQPGAPLFMMIARLFTLAATSKEDVAFWVNTGSAIESALTIMFLFWTITSLALKTIKRENDIIRKTDIAIVLGSGITGAMAYTFSDSFWFSAVESEVYALSALCTAVVFWAILRWEAEASHPSSGRWLIFISYLIGLSIGIHLLSLLTIPAIVLFYYFKKNTSPSLKGGAIALVAGCGILAFVQYGIIQYVVLVASKFELFFVNTMRMGFWSGVLIFTILLIGSLSFGIVYSHRKKKAQLNLALLCISFVLVGYSSYAMLVIRANAGTSINISNPDNVFSLLGYLSREQYGDTPLLYGRYFDSQYTASHTTGKIYRKGTDRYEVAGTQSSEEYDRNTIFPRIYSQRPEHIAAYRSWLGLAGNEKATFAHNVSFFSSYQLGFMYMRYFLWNFAGRQNDIQGRGEATNGNWISGIKPLDALHLGNQSQLPQSITTNEGYNRFFFLPLIVGLIGMSFHFRKRRTDAIVTSIFFFFTGIAIVLYLNQASIEVREREYAYAGSFYAFAVWIGLGVPGLIQAFRKIGNEQLRAAFSIILCISAAPLIMAVQGWDDHNRSDNYVAHDMAVNYLESCAPNAILFTNADNDTYSLWYAQEVEGIRPDVRIVNLQLIYNDSYIDQLKKRLRSSAPLPVTMPKEKYVKGTRDYMPYADYGITDSVELSDIFAVLTSDNDNDKVEMQDGSRLNFLPTKRFKMTVDKAQLLKTGTVKPADLPRVTDKMEWNFSGNFVSRADLALMDILAHNNWKRPIYFAVSLSEDSYFGLDRYLQLEGYAYRLLPFQRDAKDLRYKSDVTNTPVLYSNVMGKFKLDSFKKASYLDPESRRVLRNTWETMNTLTGNLISEGDKQKADKVIRTSLNYLPERNYELIDTAIRYETVLNLYRLGHSEKADELSLKASDFLGSELRYYSSLSIEDQRRSAPVIQTILSLLENYRKTAVNNRQWQTDKYIKNIYLSVSGKLS